MAQGTVKRIELAERYIEAGDFRRARAIVQQLKKEREQLETGESERLEKIIRIVGIDPAVVIGFAITFGLIVYLFVHYAL